MEDDDGEIISIPLLDSEVDTLNAALAYATCGLYVGPCRKGTKDPGSRLGKGWQHQTSRDHKVIAAWFSGTDDDVFIHAGRSGLVIFDVDDPEHTPDVLAQAIATECAPFQSTRVDVPGRGHVVFRQPPGRRIGNSPGRLSGGWGDVRGANGVIVTFPSSHGKAEQGGQYVWMQTGPVPELPAEIADLLTDGGPEVDAASDAAVAVFLREHVGNDRPGFLSHLASAETFRARVDKMGSRHLAAVDLACQALKEAHAGFYPAADAERQLHKVFLESLTEDVDAEKPKRDPVGDEWGGILSFAVGAALADDPAERRAKADERLPRDGTSDWDGENPQDGPPKGPEGGGSSPDSNPERLTLPLLPRAFWEARTTLREIRQAAHSRVVGADSLLCCILARIAAMMPHEITLDTGIGSNNASLNLLVALIGTSGTSKTSSDAVAETYLDTLSALRAIPIGSGEGMAESYMGWAPDPTDFDTKGNPKKKRQQVKHNAMFVCDEGRYLVEQSGRSGTTAVSTLRRAATGANLGHANASEDRYRDVRDYRLGLVAGFQPMSIRPLFSREEIDGGTPQRLLCCSASDRHITAENTPTWPGFLAWSPPQGAAFTVPESVKAEIRDYRIGVQSETIDVEPLDAHRPLMLVKLAALLAALEMRLNITEEDWGLAKVLYENSRGVQDELQRFFHRLDTADSERTTRAKLTHKVAEAAAVNGVDHAVQRVARVLAKKVHEKGAMTHGHARGKEIAGRDRSRGLYEPAVEYAHAQGWVLHEDAGLRPGTSRPAEEDPK